MPIGKADTQFTIVDSSALEKQPLIFMRLWRRFSQISKMDHKGKRQILQCLDTFIEKEQLKQKVQSG
jgi:hypothetical protein